MARLSRPFLGIKPQPGFSCSLADNPKSTSSPAIPRLPLVHYPCQARGGSLRFGVAVGGALRRFLVVQSASPFSSAAVAAATPPIGREKCLLFFGEFFLECHCVQ